MVSIGHQVEASYYTTTVGSDIESCSEFESDPTSTESFNHGRHRRSPRRLGVVGGLPIVGGLFGKFS